MVYFVATIYRDKGMNKAYADYMKRVVPIVKKYNGRYLIRSEKITALNANRKPDRVIIIEFDTKEHLEKCFSSEEYKSIACLREDSVVSNAIIIE